MRVNWRAALEYRTNFMFESMLSLAEVGMYLFYWKIFLLISTGITGFSFEYLAALVAFNHIIYAGADTLMGSQVWQTGEAIVRGQFDIFLVQPKSPIFQVFFSGAQPMRAIQIVVGTVLFFFFIPFTPQHTALFVFGSMIGTVIFSSWVIILHSLTFYLGNSVVIYKLLSVILHFGKKPANIFSLGVRFVLYTVIPAAFIGSVQAEQVRNPTIQTILALLALAMLAPLLAVVLFRKGMKRYESGNLIGVRM